jgi:hypothetical protein
MGQDSAPDWHALRAQVAEADGEEWDRLTEAFDAAWMAAYRAEFRRYAAERGWSQENIESGWLEDLPFTALTESTARNPEAVARQDVIESERHNDA